MRAGLKVRKLNGSHFEAIFKRPHKEPRQLHVKESQNMRLISRAPRQLTGILMVITFSYFEPCIRVYTVVTGIEDTKHAVTAEYPYSTPACSSHIGTVLYETYVAGQEESECA